MSVQSVIDRIAATNIGSTLADMLRKNAERLSEIAEEIGDLDEAMPTEKNTLDLASKSESASLKRRAAAYAEAKKALRAEYREIFEAVHGKVEIDKSDLVQEAKALHAETLKAVKFVEDFEKIPCVNALYSEIAKPEGAGMRNSYKGYAEVEA